MSVMLALILHAVTAVYSFQCSGNRCQGLKLTDILPEEYDKVFPPSMNGTPTAVEIFASVLNIRSVEEKTMSFNVDIFLHQRWVDDRLMFPENISSNSLVLDINWRKDIWKPDIYFKDFLDGKVQDTIIPYMYMRLQNDSSMFFASRLSLTLSCEMDLRRFPHDVQRCDVAMMALVNTAEEMTLNWKGSCGVFITKNVLLPQFDVVGSGCSDCTRKYDIGTFSCLKLSIFMRRRTGYYTINVYIPSILIVSMSMLTFWIPPEAVPARVTLGVTSLLTIVTKQYQASLPSVSYIVAMNIWMSCCIAFVFCSLVEFALVLWINRKFRKPPMVQPPMQLPGLDKVESTHRNRLSFYNKSKLFLKKIMPKRVDLDKVARIVFPLAFLCHVVLYWSTYGL